VNRERQSQYLMSKDVKKQYKIILKAHMLVVGGTGEKTQDCAAATPPTQFGSEKAPVDLTYASWSTSVEHSPLQSTLPQLN